MRITLADKLDVESNEQDIANGLKGKLANHNIDARNCQLTTKSSQSNRLCISAYQGDINRAEIIGSSVTCRIPLSWSTMSYQA